LERARRASRSTSPLKRGARYRVKRCVIPLTQRHARRGVSGYLMAMAVSPPQIGYWSLEPLAAALD
jgi:hypothetical protein